MFAYTPEAISDILEYVKNFLLALNHIQIILRRPVFLIHCYLRKCYSFIANINLLPSGLITINPIYITIETIDVLHEKKSRITEENNGQFFKVSRSPNFTIHYFPQITRMTNSSILKQMLKGLKEKNIHISKR